MGFARFRRKTVRFHAFFFEFPLFCPFELNRPNYNSPKCRRAFFDSFCSRPRSKARIKEEKRTLNVWFIVYGWKKNGVSVWARLNRSREICIVCFSWFLMTQQQYLCHIVLLWLGKNKEEIKKKRREKVKQNSKIHANLFQDFCGPLLLSARKKSKKKKKDILTPLTHNSQCIARAC